MMQYVSIDIETTGLDPHVHQVLEVGAVIDDLKVQAPLESLPKFHCYIMRDNYVVDPYCAFLHQAIFHNVSKQKEEIPPFVRPSNFIDVFGMWLLANGVKTKNDKPKIVPAGKNFGTFDKKFLDNEFGFSHHFCVLHRQLDPAILYFDHMVDDVLPSQQECLNRAGIHEDVEHTGLEDALQVVKLLRHKFPLSS